MRLRVFFIESMNSDVSVRRGASEAARTRALQGAVAGGWLEVSGKGNEERNRPWLRRRPDFPKGRRDRRCQSACP